MLWAFIDESKANDYILAMVVAKPSVAIALEKKLLELRMPGQRRIHFAKESDQRRRMILDQIAKFDISVYYFVSSEKNELVARKYCLNIASSLAATLGVNLFCVEREESMLYSDKILLSRHSSKFLFQLLEPHQRPGLWSADALAWAKFRGGKYFAKVKHLEKTALPH